MMACGGEERTGHKVAAVTPATESQKSDKQEKSPGLVESDEPVPPPDETVASGDAKAIAGDVPTAKEEEADSPAAEEAPVLAAPGSVAFVVITASKPGRWETRLTKALGRGLRGKVTKLSADSEAAAFGLAIIANKATTMPAAWKSYRHVVFLQTSMAGRSDETKYPGGFGFLGVFRTPSATPLYLEQGGHLWPDSYEEVLPIINSLTKEPAR